MIYVITGQTATGKTSLALSLAKKHNGELVNFDSRQVYKYLDIITGKDLPASAIWLYDIVTPDQYFSSFDFAEKARTVINDIIKRGKVPILVGGSYFYLKHYLYGFDVDPVPANPLLRNKLNKKTVLELQKILAKLDEKSINKLNNSDINNPRRLIRRIEILSYKGKLVKKEKGETIVPKQFIGIRYSKKEDLVAAIKLRVKKRLKEGAIEEVKKVLKDGYKKTDPGLKTIGYADIIKYLEGKISREQAITQWENHEVQYAKRQYTFMKKDKNISWREI